MKACDDCGTSLPPDGSPCTSVACTLAKHGIIADRIKCAGCGWSQDRQRDSKTGWTLPDGWAVSSKGIICEKCQSQIMEDWGKAMGDVVEVKIPLEKPIPAPSPWQDFARRLGNLVTEKQAAYGDAFGKAHRILVELYPHGIKVEQYEDVLTVVRILDKLFRIATNKDWGDETPWQDIAGYGILAAVRDACRGLDVDSEAPDPDGDPRG